MLWGGYGNPKEAEGSVKGNTCEHRSQERNEIALDAKLCPAGTGLPGPHRVPRQGGIMQTLQWRGKAKHEFGAEFDL